MKRIIAILAGLVFALPGLAGTYVTAQSNSPVMRVYNGFTGAVTVVVNAYHFSTGGTITVTCDGYANTIYSGAGTETVAQVGALILACTNLSNKQLLQVDTNASLVGDVMTNAILASTTNTISPDSWGNILTWDTSKTKFYQTYLPPVSRGGLTGASWAETIFGSIGGSGNVTFDIYLDNAKMFEQTYTTNAFEYSDANVGNLYLPMLHMPFGPEKGLLIRGTRAVSASTGNIGLTVE